MAGWILNESALPPEVLVIETVMSPPLRLEIQGMTRDSQASGHRIQCWETTIDGSDVLVLFKITDGVVLLAVLVRLKYEE